MPTKWTLPSDIKALLLKRWETQALLRAWLQNELPLPYVVPLKRPSGKEAAEHFSKVREWIGILREHSNEHHKNTYTIQWQRRNLRQLGSQQIPRRIVFETYDSLFSFINKRTAFSTFQTIAGQLIGQWPQAKPALAGSVFAAIENARHWSKILAVLEHFENNPRPDRYLRELNIPGVDTKFIEGRKQLLSRLLNRILPTETIDAAQTQLSGNGFEKRFGLRYDLPKIRFRILDPDLVLHGLSDLSIPIDQFARLDIDVETVFITENKINGLAFPAHHKAIVIFGLGNGIHSLQHAGWMANRAIIYWGDIDTHGFGILSRLRERFPTVRSMLMDETTLTSCREIWGQEPDPLCDKLDHLTDEEQIIYQGLANDRWAEQLRLEQERIPFDYVRTNVNSAVEIGINL